MVELPLLSSPESSESEALVEGADADAVLLVFVDLSVSLAWLEDAPAVEAGLLISCGLR